MPNIPAIPQAFFDEFGKSADDRVMDYGRACYAAALSQTAGVADGMVMVQKHDIEWIVAHVLDECDGSGPCADLAARRVRALLAAAPAASGGEVAFRSCTCHTENDKRLCMNKRECVVVTAQSAPQPPSAASVSERARIDTLALDVARRFTLDTEPQRRASLQVAVIAALEQALTQQRGSPVASICLVTDRRLPHFAAAEIQLYDGYEPKVGDKLYTTPETSADAVRELAKNILNWQPLTSINKADRLYQILVAAGLPFESVTDELESLLGRGA